MELRDYLHIIGQRFGLFISLVLIITGVFAFVGFRPAASFDAVSSVSFIKNSEPLTTGQQDFHYENFYALQASQMFVTVAIGWLAEPGVAAEIYDAAQVPLPDQSISRYGRLIKTKDLRGTSLMITTNAATAAEAERLAGQTTQVIVERVDSLVLQGVLDKVQVIATDPLSEPHSYSPWLVTLIGLVTGLILGTIWVFAANYLSQK